MRVVSLNCSNTEIVCALGCEGMLVGVDNHSDYPADVVDKLPRVGPDLNIDIKKVSELEPDIVLASLTVPGHEKVIAGLQKAGLEYIAPEPVTLEDIYKDIETIAGAIGVSERAVDVIGNMKSKIKPVKTASNHDSPRLLVQWWPKPVIAPARQSWVNGLMKAAGCINPLSDRDMKSTPLENSEVRQLNPDAIVISWCGVKPENYRPDVIYRNVEFKDMDAVKNKRVYCIPEAYLGRPSPRVVDGYYSFCKIIEDLKK